MRQKLLAGAALIVAGVIAFAAPAAAHVSVSPSSAEQGGYSKLTFRVPNEKPDASTTKVEVTIPTDKPIASVSVQAQNGWTYATEKTTLATPLSSHGSSISEVISKVTWTAQGDNAIKPGEFAEFSISVGPLPKDASFLEFKALQAYSNGDVVRWIDSAVEGQDEPERPAPKLTLAAASSDSAKHDSTESAASSSDSVKQSDVDSARTLGIVGTVLGALGLLVGLAAIATRRK